MMHRMVQRFADVLRDPHIEPQPHFHQGPESTPVVCYDEHCGSPRLDVSTS